MSVSSMTSSDTGAVPRAGAVGSKVAIRELTRTFVAKKRQIHALGPIDLDVDDGEFLCVVGPSGCGKSTLLRVIGGLLRPSAGEVAIQHDDPGKPLVATVFQDYSIFPWKSVAANVRFGLDLARVPRKEADARMEQVLDRLGLSAFRDAYPATLSGGMRQRVSIGRALIMEPELLLMDEPFAALDAQLRAVMQEQLLELWQADRRTVVFITHNLDEAILLGDRVVVMSSMPGRIVADYRVPFERPRDASLRGHPEFAAMEEELWGRLRSEVG